MPFAQLVIGPPGAGKSTYCDGMHQFLGAIGRQCSIVNLDPANDKTSYPCALDVRDLVKLEDIMEEDKLGPNGAVLYALEELEQNFDWLEEGIKELGGMSVSFQHEILWLTLHFQRTIFCLIALVKWSSSRIIHHYGTSSLSYREWVYG
jgi:GTPase SAR1 family protein